MGKRRRAVTMALRLRHRSCRPRRRERKCHRSPVRCPGRPATCSRGHPAKPAHLRDPRLRGSRRPGRIQEAPGLHRRGPIATRSPTGRLPASAGWLMPANGRPRPIAGAYRGTATAAVRRRNGCGARRRTTGVPLRAVPPGRESGVTAPAVCEPHHGLHCRPGSRITDKAAFLVASSHRVWLLRRSTARGGSAWSLGASVG